MTQEIGFVEAADDVIDFEQLPIGKPLFLYQYHSCDTAAKFPVSFPGHIFTDKLILRH
jgi:hypothetical protein